MSCVYSYGRVSGCGHVVVCQCVMRMLSSCVSTGKRAIDSLCNYYLFVSSFLSTQAPSLIVAKAEPHLLDQPVLVVQDDIGQSR